MNKTAAVEILFVKLSPLPQPTPAVCLVTVTYLLFHKQQQQLHHWRANHPGSSRTLRRSRGPLVVLGCAALLKEGGGERKGGGGGGQQAGGEQHYLITTAASAKRQAARGNRVRGMGQINLSAQPFFSPSHNTAGCNHGSQTCPPAVNTANGDYEHS